MRHVLFFTGTTKLVRFYNGATGLKTGTTDGAGSCLSATATRDDLSLVAVVMGCPTSNDRFASARGLLDFGFANYQSMTPPSIEAELAPVKVLRGVEESVMPVCDDPGKFVVEKGQTDAVKQEITLVPDLEAPVVKGQVIGKVEVLVNGELAGEYGLRASGEIARMNFPKAFGKLAQSMLRMNRGGKTAKNIEEPQEYAVKPATNGATDQEETQEECPCGLDKCYCRQIGDICGCTKKEP